MIKFGTGGWREIIGDGFTKKNVQKIANAISTKMIDEGVADKGFVIGYDRRFLSDVSARWVGEVFAAKGIKCFFINRAVPTPLVMFSINENNCHYGLTVTASHNPALYNGVKVFSINGRDANEVITKSIEDYVEKLENEEIKTLDFNLAIEKGLISLINPNNSYIDSIIESIDMKSIRDKNLKIVLDPMYGVSKTTLQTILLTARCDLDIIHENHDTLFGGKLPAPTEETLKSLANFVIENKCNFGIATDGDADRIGVIDNEGNFVHPNKVLVLLYYYLQRHKKLKGAVVRNLATTHLLDKMAESFGEKSYETPVGFKHISSKMEEVDALIGGESSGGLTVRGHILGKDGIYASAILTEMVAVTNKNISDIYKDIEKEFGEYYMFEGNFNFDPKLKDEIYNKVMTEKLSPDFGLEIEKTSYIDGCKIYFKNGGWIVTRFSGTEPLLRVFVEMNNKEEATLIAHIMKDFLEI